MTHKSFPIGFQENFAVQTPVFYIPAEKETENEGVLLFGNNTDVLYKIAAKLVLQSYYNEQMNWIIIHDTPPVFAEYFDYNNKSVCHVTITIGEKSNQNNYQLPIRFCTSQVMKDAFHLSDEETEIYSLLWEEYTHSKDKKMSFEDLLESWKASCDTENRNMQLYDLLREASGLFSTEQYSVFSKSLIFNARKSKTPVIYHFCFSQNDSINMKVFTTVILNEFKSVLKECFLHNITLQTGLVLDNFTDLLRYDSARFSVHDGLFSWGRSSYVTRVLISHEDQIPVDTLFHDVMTQSGYNPEGILDFTPTYQMLFYGKEQDKFDFLNRLHSSSIQESTHENSAKLLPDYFRNVILDARIYSE